MPNFLHAIKMPAAPKIAAVHMAKVGGGFHVQHVMHGAPTKHFVFQDPAKAMQHLRKIQANQWKTPDSNPAIAMDRTMDLGPTS